MEDDGKLPGEAAHEVVQDTAAEAADASEDAEESSAEAESGESPSPTEEEASESRKRRERRKAYIAEIQGKLTDQESRLERIKKAGEAEEAPKEEDFDDLTEYSAAKAVWMMGQKTVERETAAAREEREQLEQQRSREIEANWVDLQAEARTRLRNFDQVISNPNAVITDSMAGMIKASDAGADIAYYLGSNPAVSMRIASLPVMEQAYELGRIAASATSPRPIVQSRAPEPIKPVGSPSKVSRDPSRMTNAEYRAWREKGGGR